MGRRVYLSTVLPTHWKAYETVTYITYGSLDKITGEVVYLYGNIEARSRDSCSHGKGRSIEYFESVSVSLP
jgi:hypothetical protein